MKRVLACAVSLPFVMIVLALLAVDAVAQQSSPRGINLAPSVNERLGTGPSHLFWIRSGVSGVVDTIGNDIAFVDDAGQVISRAQLPADFVVGRIVSLDNQVILESGDGKSQITLQRSFDVNATSLLIPQPTSAPRRLAIPAVTRLSQKHLSIHSAARAANSLDVRSVTNGYLADGTEIARDSKGQRYVRWSEVVSTTPEILVRSFVGRYGGDGHLNAVTEVPIDAMDYVPTAYATVTGEGELRVMVPTQEGLEIRQLPFQAVTPFDPKTRSLPQGGDLLRRLESSIGSILKVETVLHDQGPGSSMRKAPLPVERQNLNTPVTRDEVIQAAREFISITWTLGEKNFSHAETPSQCQPPGHWKRPGRFTSSMVGRALVGIPYNWGGFDSSAGYLERINQGALAGNVCTCRDGNCVVDAAAGVDCSGFVSRAWKLTSHHGTPELPSIAPPVQAGQNFRNAKKGDIFNRAGHHVRLVESVQETPLSITVLESITAKTCVGLDKATVVGEGVAECTRSIDEFNHFKLLRYKNIRD